MIMTSQKSLLLLNLNCQKIIFKKILTFVLKLVLKITSLIQLLELVNFVMKLVKHVTMKKKIHVLVVTQVMC